MKIFFLKSLTQKILASLAFVFGLLLLLSLALAAFVYADSYTYVGHGSVNDPNFGPLAGNTRLDPELKCQTLSQAPDMMIHYFKNICADDYGFVIGYQGRSTVYYDSANRQCDGNEQVSLFLYDFYSDDDSYLQMYTDTCELQGQDWGSQYEPAAGDYALTSENGYSICCKIEY